MASGPPGEHYVATGGLHIEEGPTTLSVFAKAEGTNRVKLQILDTTGLGGAADFNLKTGDVQRSRIGPTSRVSARMQAAEGGWFHLTVTATLAGESTSAVFQLLDATGATSFAPSGQSAQISSPRLEQSSTGAARAAAPAGEPGEIWEEQILDHDGVPVTLQFKRRPTAATYEYLRSYLDRKSKPSQPGP
jgi:hypothetical protein